jgi:hypothetical protein
MKKLLSIIFVIFSVIISGTAQTNYILNEKDSTLKINEPVQLRWLTESSFYFNIRLKEKIKNHVWFISFSITNNTGEDLSLQLGSDDHLEIVTNKLLIKSGSTEVIRYKMRKVQNYAGFTQRGEITVYSKPKGKSDFELKRNDLSGYFSISGEWVY